MVHGFYGLYQLVRREFFSGDVERFQPQAQHDVLGFACSFSLKTALLS